MYNIRGRKIMDVLKSGTTKFLQLIMPFGMVTTAVAILILAGVVFCYGYWRRKRGAQRVAMCILGFDVAMIVLYMLLNLTS
jgi:hypothetical protein